MQFPLVHVQCCETVRQRPWSGPLQLPITRYHEHMKCNFYSKVSRFLHSEFPGPKSFQNLFPKVLKKSKASTAKRDRKIHAAFTQVRLEQQGRRDGAHRGRQHLQRHLRRFDSKSPDIVGTHGHLQHALREKRFGSSCVDHGWPRKGSCRT